MAHISDGKDSGREINTELNLVPFIDLMSVCIIFLLITSVWTQISMIQLGASIYAKKNEEQVEPPKPDNISFDMRVTPSGYTVSINGASVQIAKVQGKYNKKGLLTYLQQVKQRYPQKQDGILFVDDVVPYEELVRGMDVMMMAGFSSISVGS